MTHLRDRFSTIKGDLPNCTLIVIPWEVTGSPNKDLKVQKKIQYKNAKIESTMCSKSPLVSKTKIL